MPTYDFRATDPATKSCDHCREGFEVVLMFSDPPLESCPECQAPLVKVIGAPGFVKHWTKSKISDDNLRRNGFAKLVNEGNGKFRNALA